MKGLTTIILLAVLTGCKMKHDCGTMYISSYKNEEDFQKRLDDCNDGTIVIDTFMKIDKGLEFHSDINVITLPTANCYIRAFN